MRVVCWLFGVLWFCCFDCVFVVADLLLCDVVFMVGLGFAGLVFWV